MARLWAVSIGGITSALHVENKSSSLLRSTKFISHSVSGYATPFGAESSKVRVLHARPSLCLLRIMDNVQRYERWDGSSILSGGTSFRILAATTL